MAECACGNCVHCGVVETDPYGAGDVTSIGVAVPYARPEDIGVPRMSPAAVQRAVDEAERRLRARRFPIEGEHYVAIDGRAPVPVATGDLADAIRAIALADATGRPTSEIILDALALANRLDPPSGQRT